MLQWLKSIFGRPEPSGPPETIRQFRTGDPTLTRDGSAVDRQGWLIDARAATTIRLFEVSDPGVEQCLLT